VLAHLAERFSGLRAGVLLSDRNARILRRWVAPDSGILPHMDRIASLAGSSGSEEWIGTNGIGTVAEDRRARMVVGPEHYAQVLSNFMCVGAPIINPLSRKLEGVVTLNSDVEAASPLLTPLMTSTAREIEQRLLEQASHRERVLLDAFLTANRSGASVAVVGEEVFMAGPRASRMLDGVDHSMLWELVSEAVAGQRAGRPGQIIQISAGEHAITLRCSAVHEDGRLLGALIALEGILRPAGPPEPPLASGAGHQPVAAPARVAPAGDWAGRATLPGRSSAWQGVLAAASLHRRTDLPLLVVGEPGTGKLALLRAMFGDPDRGAMTIVDCTTAAEDRAGLLTRTRLALSGTAPVVALRHLDAVDDEVATALGTQLEHAAGRESARVVATACADEDWACTAPRRRLLDHIALARIELPPLRERREDIKGLIAAIAERPVGRDRLRFSQPALLAMTRAHWPGNVRQLESVVLGLAATAGPREVSVEMLPAALSHYSSRRVLTTMEQAELDAIMSAIKRSAGNKVMAARILGISRSTLYRKMRTYKLDPDKYFF
jgi:transcriptional regulator of acetoin/glycerol metabolism